MSNDVLRLKDPHTWLLRDYPSSRSRRHPSYLLFLERPFHQNRPKCVKERVSVYVCSCVHAFLSNWLDTGKHLQNKFLSSGYCHFFASTDDPHECHMFRVELYQPGSHAQMKAHAFLYWLRSLQHVVSPALEALYSPVFLLLPFYQLLCVYC